MSKIVLIVAIIIIMMGLISGIIIYFFVLNKKKELEIEKSISAGIPFKWEVEIEDKEIVEYVRSYVVKDENKGGLVGAKVHTNYVFKGIKEGKTNIIFKFINFTNNKVDHEDKYLVTVDSNLNISLEE